jgi:carbon dioxide concentrating mechanism protein CcmN
MSVSPLYPISNSNSYISGEVTIDPTAVIAAGVLLQAAPNSKIIIAAGVCIGMGTVLHAHDGILEIEAGAILGAGVLVVGKGKIGANACIGSVSTIMDCSIEPRQVITPGSLLGDTSRQVAEAQPTANHITTSSPDSLKQAAESSISQPDESESEQKSQPQSELTTHNGTQVVYGKASLTQLISTLFPHSHSLNQPMQDGSSQSDST